MSRPIDSEWLRCWHDAHPGATQRAFTELRDPEGRSSYDRLAKRVRPGDRVLDLACGDGALLSKLADRAGVDLVGVDFSAGELAEARARIGDRARLVEARVQSLPFEAERFDRVLCHQALMLFDGLETVLGEVARVLKPGGALHAVVSEGGSGPRDDAWGRLVADLRTRTFVGGRRLIDSRALRPDRLDPLLADAGFAETSWERFELGFVGGPDALWAFFSESYDPAFLSPEDLRGIRARIAADAAAAEPVGSCLAMLPKLELSAVREPRAEPAYRR